MAITDTSPTETATGSAPGASDPTGSAVPNPRGLAGILGSGDHMTIGRLYIGTSLLFGLLTFGLMGWFGIDAMSDVHSDRAPQAFTLGQLGLVFLFLMPLFIGLATAIVPLQVGANTIAFPRAAAAAFWTWAMAGILLCVSYLPSVGGGIAGGEINGQGLTFLALAGLVIALLLATVCIITTVVTLRTSGMTLDRVPMFSWSMVVAGGLSMLTLPVWLANVALIFVDATYGSPAKYGVATDQWAQLSWVVTQPQIFVFAIPALGIIADAIATFAHARQPQRGMVLGAIGAFGALGFGAYAQNVFNPGVHHNWLYVAQGALILLPVLMFLGGMIGSLRHGKPTLASPFLNSVVALLLLLLGAFAGAAFGLGRLGLQSTAQQLVQNNITIRVVSKGEPIYTWGVTAIVVVAAAAAGIAGVYYWGAKLSGRKLPDGLGKLLAPILLVAGLLAGAPYLALGLVAKADGLADSANALYAMSVAGMALAGLALLLTVGPFIAARAAVIGGGATAEADAWGAGQSLEWASDSPPVTGNFGQLAEVTSPQPLLDLAEGGQS